MSDWKDQKWEYMRVDLNTPDDVKALDELGHRRWRVKAVIKQLANNWALLERADQGLPLRRNYNELGDVDEL